VLGDILKQLRTERGLRQEDIAIALGVSVNTISGYERNYRKPPYNQIVKLCDFFGVSMDYLTKGEDNVETELEKNFGDDIRILRRAGNELTSDDKERLARYVKFMLEENERRKSENK
jgi:transcriptional regulator with XRE-family HTH domain